MDHFKIQVRCYAGHRGEQTPRAVTFCSREICVDKILDMWLAPDHRYFKFLGSDKGIYIIRHDEEKAAWELTFYREHGKDYELKR